MSLFTACTNLTPAYERAAAPVAGNVPTSAASSGPAAAALPWNQFFTDARLAALVDLALKNNRDLRVAVQNVEQARVPPGVQRADQLPSLSAGLSASRAPNSSGKEANTFSAVLEVSAFELDLLGRVRSLSDAALARYLLTDEGRRASQESRVAAVANADLALRADDELLQVTQRALNRRQGGLKLVRVKFADGASAGPDLRSAESMVAAARVSLFALQRQRAQNLNALVLLPGQSLPDGQPAATPLAPWSSPTCPLVYLPKCCGSAPTCVRPNRC